MIKVYDSWLHQASQAGPVLGPSSSGSWDSCGAACHDSWLMLPIDADSRLVYLLLCTEVYHINGIDNYVT